MALFSRAKYLRLAKGYYGRAKNCLKITIPKVEKALQYAYIGRRLKPRNARRQYITTINSAVREHGMRYSSMINALTYSNIALNRKILADLSVNEPYSFKAIVDELKVQAGLVSSQKPKTTIEDLVMQNLLVRTKVPAKLFIREDKEVRTEYITFENQKSK